jgi:hypothetical protein
LEDVDSILEKSVSIFKKKNLDDPPLKKSLTSNNQSIYENSKKEENLRYEKNDVEDKSEKSLKNLNSFEKIRSVTPKIERSKFNNMPGSTRSITPLDKGEREFNKPSYMEKAQKTPENQNNYQNRIFAEINANTELKKQSSQYDYINAKIHSIRNEINEQNKENIIEKTKQNKKILSAGNKEVNNRTSKILLKNEF